MNHLSLLRIARFGSNAEEPSIARTHWFLHEIWHYFINIFHGRLPSSGRKVLSEEAFSDVRIPCGYHNRKPLDWSPLALRYVLLRQYPDFQKSLGYWKSHGTPRHAGCFASTS